MESRVPEKQKLLIGKVVRLIGLSDGLPTILPIRSPIMNYD